MRIFLDASVILAACGSSRGASRAVFDRASKRGWTLVATPYVLEEVARSVGDLGAEGVETWARLRQQLVILDDVLTLDRAVVFESSKDKPVLFAALAWSKVLLTLDRADFGPLLGTTFYGLLVLKPGDWIRAFPERV